MISDKNIDSKEHSYDENGKCNEQLCDGYGLNIKQEVWIECCEKYFGMNGN
jgi:hypothetical protein